MDVSDLFYFFCSVEGKGESEAPEGGGVGFLLKIPGGRGLSGEGGWRWGGCLQGISRGGGGTKYIFSVPKRPPRSVHRRCFQLGKLKCLNRQKEVWRIPRNLFQGKKKELHVHQRAFKVFVGDPFAQYWCIDFGLLFIAFQGVFCRTFCLGRFCL